MSDKGSDGAMTVVIQPGAGSVEAMVSFDRALDRAKAIAALRTVLDHLEGAGGEAEATPSLGPLVEHPAPWRWSDVAYGHPDTSTFDRAEELVDANGDAVVFAEETEEAGLMVSRREKELIRLAPEMEQALRFFVEMTEGMSPVHPQAAKARELLAALDAARKATP